MILSPAQTIAHKRDGNELTDEQIRAFIGGVSKGDIPDYQATAFLMAVYFKGMTFDETVSLTRAMLESGIRYNLSDIQGAKVDKHSTGGVGDKVSLILAPLAAACGLKVPMMAGRGLGHSGGTLDKLEAISGFSASLSEERFRKILTDNGCAIIGQTAQVAPADRKLYALRDVTATVECIPLIVASILSKKLAEGSEALVMDIKVGSGAFMKNKEQARKLTKTLLGVAKKMNLPCRALLTDMSQPLGCTAGNALEVQECIAILKGEKCEISHKKSSRETSGTNGDLRELTIQLCAHMLELGKVARNLTEGRKIAHAKLADGSAWKKFQTMIQTQGGSLDQILNPEKLPHTKHTVTWNAKKSGYINKMDTEAIGWILVEMGGGRRKATDRIDAGVGMIFQKKIGAKVKAGEPLVSVHYTNPEILPDLERRFQDAIEISGARKAAPKLILEQIG